MRRHPWLRQDDGGIQALGDLGPIRRNYLVADYRRDAANQNVVASVHVEAGWDPADDPLAEIRWLETLDKSAGIASRYIACAPLAAPNAAPVLDGLGAHPRVVGIREKLSWHPADRAKCFAPRPGIADEPGWRRNLALLGSRGFLLELMIYPYQADEIFRLARDFPDQQFIIDHCGSPIDRDAAGMARWREAMKRLGGAPNIALKVSALTAYDPHPTSESLRGVVRHCLDCFGPDRSMFGSDFPVGRLWTTFDAIFDGFRRDVEDLAEAEQRALFHDNARRYYRMT